MRGTVGLAKNRVGEETLSVKKLDIVQVWQAGSFLLCTSLAWRVASGYEGTEFSGGWLTGPLLSMVGSGTVLFIIAIVLTFVFPRVAAAIGLAASVLCLPLYFFFIAPIPFAEVFARGHEFKVQPAPGFHGETWPVIALFATAIAMCLCIRRFASKERWSANPAAGVMSSCQLTKHPHITH